MVRRVCKNKMTYEQTSASMEKASKLPSLFQPEDSYTVRQLFDRMARGLPLDQGVYRTVNYQDNADYDSPDMEEISRMDLADRHEYLEQVRLDIRDKEAALKKAAAKKQKDAKEPPKAAEEGVEGKPKVAPDKTKDVTKKPSTTKKDSSS